MAKSLLNTVNEILKRAKLIQGDAAALSSLTDSPRQVWINIAIMVINEGISDLYDRVGEPIPNELAENTITLVTSTRTYSLASDLVILHWPLIDKTNSHKIFPYEGGYLKLLNDQVDPSQYTGLPHWGVILPTDGTLYLDRIPTASENGNIYTYQYEKDLELSLAADTVPFDDVVWRQMVPAWMELWRRENRNTFDEGAYNKALALAGGFAQKEPKRSSWWRRR